MWYFGHFWGVCKFQGSLQKLFQGLCTVDPHPKGNLPANFERNRRDPLAHILWYSQTCSLKLSATLGEFFRDMCLFFLVHLSMSSYTKRWGWSLSFFELRTGRKVRKCGILTICADLWISMYISITWLSCNVSGCFDLIFGLLVGRWHPHSVI